MKNILIRFRLFTDPQVLKQSDVLSLENYEKKVRADIKRGIGGTYIVHLKHLMPRSEMDRGILGLCERICHDGHPPIPFGTIARQYTFAGEPNCEEKVVEACYQFVV